MTLALLAQRFHTPIGELETMPMWQIAELAEIVKAQDRER